MSKGARRALLALLLACPTLLRAAGVSCHIHPPGSTPQAPRGTVGPFDSLAACEEERQRLFGATGRCHCAADFSPRWLPAPDAAPPGLSPLG